MDQQFICTIRERQHVQDDHKLRIALGVYDDLTRLRTTLGEFEGFGLDLEHTVIVADPGALGGKLEGELSTLAVSGRSVTPNLLIRGNAHDGPIEFADWPSGFKHTVPADQLLQFDNWISGSLSEDLNNHLASGACVLIAPVTTAQLEWRISNTLLKYSLSQVQLHDLTSPH